MRKSGKNRAVGIILLVLGCCCLIAATAFVLHNRWVDTQAGENAEQLSGALDEILDGIVAVSDDTASVSGDTGDTGMGMDTLPVNGYDVCGRLRIPSIGISLAIIDEWSYPNLRISACRYSGSPEDRFVILAHNYARHFGKLGDLSVGDAVQFTGVDGRVHDYEVTEIEIISGTRFEDIIGNDGWDLTLFTCTFTRVDRTVVRCSLVAPE